MTAGPLLRVGIIGYGIMGKAHSYGYRVAPILRPLPVTPVVTVMSGRQAASGRWVTVREVTSDVRKPKERDFWPDG